MSTTRYSRVAVIGAGPSGLATAKALALEPHPFLVIDVYDRQSHWGGVWNYDNSPKDKSHRPHEHVSAMYTHLETNLTKRLMEFSGMPFPGGEYPNRHQVMQYLEDYGKTIPKSVNFKFGHNVASVEKIGGVWKVTTYDGITTEYDAIVIANGHNDEPYTPEIDGLKQWRERRPNTVSHAKYFTTAERYRDQTVVIVGNSYSGVDISAQVAVYAKKVYVSSRTRQKIMKIDISNVEEVTTIEKLNVTDKTVELSDGRILQEIDSILFCTGYIHHVPFLHSYRDILSSKGVSQLYHQVFYCDDPSLSFVTLQNGAVPFPLSELQAAVIARVYSGRLALPTTEKMKEISAKEYRERGGNDHFFDYPDDVALYRFYYGLLANEPRLLDTGLNPVYWDEELRRVRDVAAATKIARMKEIYRWANTLREQNKPFTLAPHQKKPNENPLKL
ncbi:hypothetical protein DIURU_005182 [Diutina rugosa]|uniref:FAD/NAD(P)-binding domain-containing protein n=1 Tax=Diutina rugosa TaxID=5481 RepID=A0A642UEK3_DIURU|nr:uncharacterized protein DIURU_005182 [Diutina rugosa]KAA8897583.1 hypothetical protein DIURU_005182 [Diutina rugosa]